MRLDLSVNQNFILAVTIGDAVVLDIDRGLTRIFTSRYGIPLSDMVEAVKPFSQQVGARGASYKLTDIRNLRCSPAQGTFKKCNDMVRDIKETRVWLMTKKETEKMAGMHMFAMSLVHDGTNSSNVVYECMNMSTRTGLDMKVI